MSLSNISHPLRLKVVRISATRSVRYSTKTQRIFADSKSAEFVAGAVNASSIPELHGLPEVRHCFSFFPRVLYSSSWKIIVTGIRHFIFGTLQNGWAGLSHVLISRTCKCREVVFIERGFREKFSPAHQQESRTCIPPLYTSWQSFVFNTFSRERAVLVS